MEEFHISGYTRQSFTSWFSLCWIWPTTIKYDVICNGVWESGFTAIHMQFLVHRWMSLKAVVKMLPCSHELSDAHLRPVNMVCHKAILPAKCGWKIDLAGKNKKLPARMTGNKICQFWVTENCTTFKNKCIFRKSTWWSEVTFKNTNHFKHQLIPWLCRLKWRVRFRSGG